MILVTGGSRSGKSEFAEKLTMRKNKMQKDEMQKNGTQGGGRFLYMATAKITDAEMQRRVEKHQARRSSQWTTHEGYKALWKVLEEASGQYDGILLDSVSTMLTNMLFDFIGDVDWDTFDFASVDYKKAENEIIPVFEKLGRTAKALAAPLVIVTDETGLGVVPDTYLGRAFRDMLGLANQKLAAAADEVYFVVSGIPVKIKGE